MVKAKLALLCLVLLPLSAAAQDIQWKRDLINASRTGVTVPQVTNVKEALGTVNGRTYAAPNGKIYRGGTVGKVAGCVINAQPEMSWVKESIAYSSEEMQRAYPQSAVTNWFVDNIMEAAEAATGRKVDVGICNFGGIRIDMPQGDVLVDDIRSMFPFKNNLVYVSLKGRDLRAVLNDMAATHFQILGGMQVVAKGNKIVSVKIGGKPLDDNKVYGMATISFLLNGGDNLYLSKNAIEVVDGGIDIYEAMISQIKKAPKENGLPVIKGQVDDRLVINK